MAEDNKKDSPQKIKVWDAPTRLFHWALVIAVILSSYSAFEDKFGIYADIHLWAGFTVLTLVSWRLVWGFLGSETSRFKNFITSPKTVLAYAFKKEPYSHTGHNPLGGYSVITMLLLLFVQASLGLFATDDMFFSGPFTDNAGEASNTITDIHELLGYGLFGLIGLHLLVILYYWVWQKINLILPMITGFKYTSSNVKAPKMRSTWLALIILGLMASLLYWQIYGSSY